MYGNTEQNSGMLALVNKTEATADYMTDAINDNTVFVNKRKNISGILINYRHSSRLYVTTYSI